MKNYKKSFLQSGFTITELMIAVAIAAVLLTIGVPSFQETLANNRLDTKTHTVANSLKLARSEAIKRGVAVSVCPSNTGTSCVGNDLAQGWIIFTDLATPGVVNADGADGTANTADDEVIIQYYTPADSGTLSVELEDDSGIAKTYVRFSSRGFILAVSSTSAVNQFVQQLPVSQPQPDTLLSQILLKLLPIQSAYSGTCEDGCTIDNTTCLGTAESTKDTCLNTAVTEKNQCYTNGDTAFTECVSHCGTCSWRDWSGCRCTMNCRRDRFSVRDRCDATLTVDRRGCNTEYTTDTTDCGDALTACGLACADTGGSTTSSTTSGGTTSTTSGGDSSTTSGGDSSTTSGGDSSTTSGGDSSTTSGGDSSTTSGGDTSTTSGGDTSTTSGGSTTSSSSSGGTSGGVTASTSSNLQIKVSDDRGDAKSKTIKVSPSGSVTICSGANC
ncbi:MAG: prepilin-type N-terminal cleavage/methylation domain-containing protein [Gammaproteobacteria bacterium]|nr:prepilin-type N-terminal cleavage/methylation domain-containing protein [Gammaproteobacteria bacterium]